MLHPRTFTVSDDLYHRAGIAAASLDISVSEYIRRALVCVLAADASDDPLLASAFGILDNRTESPVRERMAVA